VQGANREVFKVRAFAELAGVTVRALHHYDRLALLRPKRTRAGYRVYSARDLERLEQIVALKFLGFPLKQIKTMLDRDSRSVGAVLRAQRRALEEKRRRLDQAIGVIADAERSIRPGGAADSAVLKRIIEVFDMSDQNDEMRKYYSDAAWTELAKRRDEMAERLREIAMEGTRKWQALFKDITASLDADPAGPVAQALLDRWKSLIEEFTGGNPEIREGIGRAWEDRDNWSEERKQQAAPFADPRVWEFIRKAGAARTAGSRVR
jgi:MerR family transcriptional regulator, thiopeptide resistance regulator